MIIPTISVRQPWAWLICSFKGVGQIPAKRIENRERLKNIKGRHLIHAGLKFDKAGYEAIIYEISVRPIPTAIKTAFLNQLPYPGRYQLGGIVGWADFAGEHVTASDDFWFAGPNGLLIKEADELPFHRCKGALSIFKVDYPDALLKRAGEGGGLCQR